MKTTESRAMMMFFIVLYLSTYGRCALCPFCDGEGRGGAGEVQAQRRARQSSTDLDDVIAFLKTYNEEASAEIFRTVTASWTYERNLTDENAKKNEEAEVESAAFYKRGAERARDFDSVVDTFPDDVQRQLALIRDIGISALDDEKVAEYASVMAEMSKIYSSSQICRPDNATDCLYLDPGLQTIMSTSRDWQDRLWAWQGFRDAVGRANKPLFTRYVELVNEGARVNGFDDQGDAWRDEYGDDLEEKADELYNAILPLYQQLHAYVRRKLSDVYGASRVSNTGYLPAHLLGDMWGRFWGNLYPIVVPFPDRPNIDVTEAMIEQNYTVTRIFEDSIEFFSSLGLPSVNDSFWEKSMLTRPDDGREVVCHPSAWDFGVGDDFRVAMCTKVTMEDFLIVHHEMGHVQYFIEYRDLPAPFRDSPNGAFHEAIGEVMSLSVGTPKHLEEVGLFGGMDPSDKETEINFLLKTSLDTIGTLPFSLGLAKWRWDLFRGEYDVGNSMSKWWEIKNNLVGVEAPVVRTDEDFDPGAMFHFIIDYPFIGYYIRTIIQFQFYKALCEAANHTGPLHTCDFYRSEEAGHKLSEMLALGKSKPWPDAMEALTGQREMSADAILEYYQPLMDWLTKTNADNGDVVGWPITAGASGVYVANLCILAITSLFAMAIYI